ncbi:MAG: hypothetical protein H7145_02760 [Akkermansiaceae bacterium]|nr:hypothetical protein [Armatimonadota bacterium]
MNSTPTSTQWTRFVKGAFVFIFCTAGGASLVLPQSGLSGTASGSSPVPIFAGVLLTSVSLAAFWRGTSGRHSATWAVLSFGSWMTLLFTMLAHVVWAARDISLTDGYGFVAGAAILILVACNGLRAAWRNDWDGMGRWMLATFVILFFLGPQYHYAGYFRNMRGKSALQDARTIPVANRLAGTKDRRDTASGRL